jgi:hypothetical protein
VFASKMLIAPRFCTFPVGLRRTSFAVSSVGVVVLAPASLTGVTRTV